jgi:hypothetical protein
MSSPVVTLRSIERRRRFEPMGVGVSEPYDAARELASGVLQIALLLVTRSELSKRPKNLSRAPLANAVVTALTILGDCTGLQVREADCERIKRLLRRLPIDELNALAEAVEREAKVGAYARGFLKIIRAARLSFVIDARKGEAAFCDARRLEEAQRLGLEKLAEPEPPLIAYLQRWINQHDAIERLVATNAREAEAGEEPAYDDATLRWSFAEWLAIALIGVAPFVGYRVLNSRKAHLERIFRRWSLADLRVAAQRAKEHLETGNVQGAYDTIRALWRRPVVVFEVAA